MILITVKIPIRPEKTDEWLALADSYTKACQAEPGNIFFQFAQSLDDPNEYICIEGFQDGTGGDHMATSHVANFMSTMPDLVSAQPQILYLEAEHDGFGPMGEIQPR